jgi:hypothetical protein
MRWQSISSRSWISGRRDDPGLRGACPLDRQASSALSRRACSFRSPKSAASSIHSPRHCSRRPPKPPGTGRPDVFLSFNLSSAQLIDPATGFQRAGGHQQGRPRPAPARTRDHRDRDDERSRGRRQGRHRTPHRRHQGLARRFRNGPVEPRAACATFAFNKVKIDRSFVSEITFDKSAEHIVRAILA